MFTGDRNSFRGVHRGLIPLLVASFVGACGFDPQAVIPPLTVVRPDAAVAADRETPAGDAGFADAAAEDTLVVEVDGGDAAVEPDAIVSLPDAELPDGAFEDAAADDATAPDADALDATPAADARPSDAGQLDAGCGPAALAANQLAPRSAGTVTLPFSVDLPPLIADLDGDGQEEIAVGSTIDQRIAVIDYEGCSASPVVTVTNAGTIVGISETGLTELRIGGVEHIAVSNGTSVSFYRYTRPPAAQINAIPGAILGSPISGFGGDDTGGMLVNLGQPGPNQGRAMTLSTSVGMPLVDNILDVPVGAPALLDPSATPKSFVVTTVSEPRLLRPGSGTAPFAFAGFQPASSAVTLRPGIASADLFFAFAGTNAGGNALIVHRILQPTASDLAISISQSSAVLEPIGITWGPPDAPSSGGFFYLTENHTLLGCVLAVVNNGAFRCDAAGIAYALPRSSGSSHASISTAYVGTDSIPDLVVLDRDRIHFRAHTLGPQLQPDVTLSRDAAAPAATSTRFHDRYGGPRGFLMVVPLDRNTVELVVWQRPALAGADQHLWLQSRRDPRRSGRL